MVEIRDMDVSFTHCYFIRIMYEEFTIRLELQPIILKALLIKVKPQFKLTCYKIHCTLSMMVRKKRHHSFPIAIRQY